MEAMGFDRLARSLSDMPSRRGFLSGLAATLGIRVIHPPDSAEARKKRKKKLVRNAFGCVDVGKACRGNAANCCSGICQGKKPKKGKKDKSHCVAHDTGGCQAGQSATTCGGSTDVPCTTNSGFDGFCLTTTGNAGYCFVDGSCRQCSRDAECQAEFGPQAACTLCTACIQGTSCAVPDDRIGD